MALVTALVTAPRIHRGQTTTAAATARGRWFHTIASTATTRAPIPATPTVLHPRLPSRRSSAAWVRPLIIPVTAIPQPRPAADHITPAVPLVAVPSVAVRITPVVDLAGAVPIIPAAALVAAPSAAALITPAEVPVVGLAAAHQAASAVPPTTAAIHQVAARLVVSAALHLEEPQHPVTPVAVITAAAIMACIDHE